MLGKIADSLGEILYTSGMFFVYCYIYMTVVRVSPSFSLGFHPPTDMHQLAMVASGVIVLVVATKIFTLVVSSAAPQEPPAATTYTPAQRKCV